MSRWIAGIIVAVGVGSSVAAHATAYDPLTAFTGSNPSGPFTFGYTIGLGGTLVKFDTFSSVGGYSGWTAPTIDPYLGAYATSTQVTMHPGPSNQFSVIEFVAPTSGSYSVVGSFSDGGAATTDTHVFVNGVSRYSGLINGGTSTDPFSLSATLTAGQVVDFVLGNGDNSYSSDTTNLQVTITSQASAVREPMSWSLLGLAACGLVVIRNGRKGGSSFLRRPVAAAA